MGTYTDSDVFESYPHRDEGSRIYRRGNRGKAFEMLIEHVCQMYRNRGIARIDKNPTPTKNINGRIVYEKKGIVDFIGTIKGGRTVCFDAKSTRTNTRYPISDRTQFPVHQLEYLKDQHDLGAAVFLLIEFTNLGEHYLLPYTEISRYIEIAQAGGRKSIPYNDFQANPNIHRIAQGPGLALDFLKPVLAGKI